ncbi:Acetyltransferase (GNAT) domain-containing protein [Candidatus Electrothrix aarhusensis]|uniref:Acetyltransferase (GNAT) domain-containing protein n=1 Tax=Candidatus Electrothrix aarhusensis TaxID=1859131 RepID=A0A444J0P1_9BACT|nr:Acetyltransferase (GNAT) domain-containing protein [Candidatus Electrothrix aarhusensis]
MSKMSNSVFSTFSAARDLPTSWDKACKGNPFLCKASLRLLEQVNPTGQRYYLLENEDRASLFMTYQHRLDILTYGPGNLRLPVAIVGIPCSVSWPGLQIQKQDLEPFRQALQKISGALLLLNGKKPPLSLSPICAKGLTLPNCELDIRGFDFSAYLGRMRSHYRYKIRASLKRFQGVKTSVLKDNSEFDSKLYKLYEQVYQRSDFKLEKLDISFFQQFPATISVFSVGDKLLGFTQTMFSNQGDQEQIFLFGGLDYNLNEQFHTYINMLLHVIRSGMEQGSERVNLGQTAEDVKTKLGCTLHRRLLYARHSNSLVHFFIHRGISLLSYTAPLTERHVFK